MKKILYTLFAAALCVSCAHVDTYWVDLEDFSSLDPKKCFIPSATETNEMSERTFCEAKLPGGSTVGELMNSPLSRVGVEADTVSPHGGVHRTSSFDTQALFKELFSNWHSDQAVSFTGSYESIDAEGNPIRLSGRIIVPADRKVSRIMIVNHYTIGANSEAPSKTFPLEGIFAARGLALVVPDYLGFGVTSDHVHPYLNADLTARNVVDMYMAAKPFLEHIGCQPEHDDFFIYGYSQGGAVATAVHRYVEQNCPEETIRLTLAGGGPYDICATYDQMIAEDNTDYPCVIPMIIQGFNESLQLGLDYNDYFSPKLMANLDEWLNSKKYTVDQITTLSGSKKISVLITENAQNKVTDDMTVLYMAMLDNSIAGNFHPKAPLYIFHSVTDNVVPFVNAANLQQYLNRQNCNVRYNFGDYGIHRMGCVRFLYTALSLLQENGDIESVF